MAWKKIARRSQGNKHKKRSITCQDYVDCQLLDNNQVIIGAIADGAGSIKCGERGAELAVKNAILTLKEQWSAYSRNSANLAAIAPSANDLIIFGCDVKITIMGKEYGKSCRFPQSSVTPPSRERSPNSRIDKLSPISHRQAEENFNLVLQKVKSSLEKEAKKQNNSIQDYACTLLAFIATPNWIAAMQIGDGFIVARQSDKNYETLLNPQKGQHINETIFVTSINSLSEIGNNVRVCHGHYKFICASTDGLELASLQFGDWQPSPPFFEPLEDYIKEVTNPDNETEIQNYLDSDPSLNRSTDDDKTLLLCFYE